MYFPATFFQMNKIKLDFIYIDFKVKTTFFTFLNIRLCRKESIMCRACATIYSSKNTYSLSVYIKNN